mmetsp:Transcript_11117/g.16546  ORF Transcript_11117/g.16546 Transcript_11117/m.16546 type:complete len:80 (+) Transcript_11117:164-403(+)
MTLPPSITTQKILQKYQKPNKLTSIYTAMKQNSSCSKSMQSYATCVLQNHRSGDLSKEKCQVEFDEVKKCFRAARNNSL